MYENLRNLSNFFRNLRNLHRIYVLSEVFYFFHLHDTTVIDHQQKNEIKNDNTINALSTTNSFQTEINPPILTHEQKLRKK